MERIQYRRGYYYQLVEDYSVTIPELAGAVPSSVGVVSILIGSHAPAIGQYSRVIARLTSDGNLTAFAGYAWDGASGPMPDTHTVMRASLAHDLTYQFMRYGKIGPEWREPADMALRRICVEDGMWGWVASGVYQGVRLGGGPSVDPANRRPVIVSPKVILLRAA